TGDWPAQMRALGAGTVYFDLNLRNRVGTPSVPTATATMPDRAQKLFTFAVQQTGCTTPLVVFNELSGPGLVTPWSATNTQYRANVLSLLQNVAALGAHPVLLLPAKIYAGGDALAWWQQVAAVSEIVREIYVPATATWKQGPILGNRNLRNSYRDAVTDLTSIGIPANKVGLMVSFATTKGFGGRSGRIRASATQMTRTVETLVAEARLQASGPRGSCELAGVLETVVGASRESARQHGCRIELDPTPPGLRVGASADLVERIVHPIVENACSYGSSTVHISLVRRGASRIQVRISDDGSGIVDDERERIFEPGVRGRAGNANGHGAGLGLALARRLATSAGATIEAPRSANGGLVVVELPTA
ncbi:MAG: hypothetical protein QOJ47_1656, partial [Gaiellales bacterium]|nr:hypothetical protein [Gaiellales bacterium]